MESCYLGVKEMGVRRHKSRVSTFSPFYWITRQLSFDAFELWCWGRLLRVPWSTRRSNYSIPNETSLEYSLEGLILKLKLQYFGHLKEKMTHLKRFWCWERLKVGGKGDDRGWYGWMASLTRWTWVWANSRSYWWREKPGVHGVTKSWRRLRDWTELNTNVALKLTMGFS